MVGKEKRKMSVPPNPPPLFPGPRAGARAAASRSAPLADRMRPKTLAGFVGQESILG